MMGLLSANNKVWLQSENPERKLKYTKLLKIKSMVGVNTHLTNKIVLEALEEIQSKIKI